VHLKTATSIVHLQGNAIEYSCQPPYQVLHQLMSGSPQSHEQAVLQALAREVLRRSFRIVRRLQRLTTTSPHP